jgi:hypothetical protein
MCRYFYYPQQIKIEMIVLKPDNIGVYFTPLKIYNDTNKIYRNALLIVEFLNSK